MCCRDTFKELQKFQLNPHLNEPLFPSRHIQIRNFANCFTLHCFRLLTAVPKRARLLTPPPSPSSPPTPLTLCLSPNAGCAAIATEGFIHQLHLGSLLLGAKGQQSASCTTGVFKCVRVRLHFCFKCSHLNYFHPLFCSCFMCLHLYNT